jgi:hypothetical protein
MKNLLNLISKSWQCPDTMKRIHSVTMGFCYDHVSETPGNWTAKNPARQNYFKHQQSTVLNKY